ncbi:MAG: DUF222 domain-containing protein [Aeromicrobium sp.]
MSLKLAVAEADLADAARVRARAEAEEYRTMLAFHEVESDKAEATESPLRRQVEKSMIPLTIGQAMGLSEGQASARVAMAQRVRDNAPQTWLAFGDGRIDASRVREISQTIERLQREDSVIRLDQRVVTYAESHTVAELRAWLRRFVVRVEGDLAAERAEAERVNRHVDVFHGEEGMSWLYAYLPSYVVAAVAKRLDKEAVALGSDDSRTKAQRRADLLASWATTNDSGEAAVNADIAVSITADVLAGSNEGFGISADGQWVMPAAWIAEVAASADPFWHRMILDPVTHDVLAHEYQGRYAPTVLAKALAFRDGVCEAPGCLKPADRCDIDHREPWPGGSTSGVNLGPKCRKHHILKGHGLLRIEPSRHAPPHGPISRAEHHFAGIVVEYAA